MTPEHRKEIEARATNPRTEEDYHELAFEDIPALLSALDAAEERVRELGDALEMSWAYLDQLAKDGMKLPNIDIVQGSNLAALKAEQGRGE